MEESQHPVVVQPVLVSRVRPVPQAVLITLPSGLHASVQASLMVANENGVHESAPGALAPAARYVKDVSEK